MDKIKIQSAIFSLARTAPFVEGHVLTQAEANALNQTWTEGVRNNFAGRVRKVLGDEKRELTPEEFSSLQSELDTYVGEYEFSIRTARAPVDPVDALARKMAGAIVRQALTEKGYKVKELPEGRFDSLVDSVLAKNEHIRKEAAKRHAAEQKLSASVVDGLDLAGSEG